MLFKILIQEDYFGIQPLISIEILFIATFRSIIQKVLPSCMQVLEIISDPSFQIIFVYMTIRMIEYAI